MIWDTVKVFTNVRSSQKLYADDWFDKLNRSTTVILLLIAASFIYSNKFFSTQISCLDEPNKLVPIGLDYVNSLCLAKDTYTTVDFFAENSNANTYQHISYYPWLFFIVCSFAFVFYAPYLLWKAFVRNNYYHHMPVDISGIVDLLRKSNVYKKDDFSKSIKLASEYLDKCFSVNNFNDGLNDDEGQDTNMLSNKQPKSYYDRRNKRTKMFYCPLVLKYVFVKLCYLLVSVCVFFLVARFLQLKEAGSFYAFGFDAASKWFQEPAPGKLTDYLESRFLPRVIFCDIHVRADKKNNIHHHQYQCALPANVFNEKVFIVMWAWFMVMICINVYSLVKWMIKLCFRRTIVKNILLWPYKYDYEINRYVM